MISFIRQLLAAILSLAVCIPTYGSAVGNRKQLASTLAAVPAGLWNYDANDHFTAGDTYDANGNTVSSGGVAAVYDFENHLIQKAGVTIVGACPERSRRDGDGNRVSKTAAGVTTTYWVDTLNPTGYAQVVYESFKGGTAGNGELNHSYVYGLELISQLRNYQASFNNFTQRIYYVYDGHGSVRALTDPTGAVTDTYDYDAFGNLLHSSTTLPTPTLNNYLFAGEQFDPDLNLYYNRARYLNVSTGRFWTMDPTEGNDKEPFTLHKYLYAGADSINRSDPSGHDFTIAEAITVAVVISIVATIPTAHDSIRKTEIEVHFDEIPAFRSAHHAYLLLKNPLGLTIIFRGGPSVDYNGGGASDAAKDFSNLVPDSADLGHGYIWSGGSGEVFGPLSIDYPRNPGDDVASVEVPDVTQSYQQVYSSFMNAAQTIDNMHIPYHPVSQNSNSFANTLLVKANLHSPPPPVWTPGWEHILY